MMKDKKKKTKEEEEEEMMNLKLTTLQASKAVNYSNYSINYV